MKGSGLNYKKPGSGLDGKRSCKCHCTRRSRGDRCCAADMSDPAVLNAKETPVPS